MEMGMPEPGEMWCCSWEAQEPTATERKLERITGLHGPANHIIISNRRASYSI